MAQNHVAEGKIMRWTNGGAAAVSSGDVVVVNDLVCVALGDIAIGATGSLAVCEVFTLPKEAPLVINQGDNVYWDETNENIDKTDTNVPAGKCWKDAASADTTVQVLLNVI